MFTSISYSNTDSKLALRIRQSESEYKSFSYILSSLCVLRAFTFSLDSEVSPSRSKPATRKRSFATPELSSTFTGIIEQLKATPATVRQSI